MAPFCFCPQSFPTSQALPYIHIFWSSVDVYMLSAPSINHLFSQLTFLCGWSTGFHSIQIFPFLIFIYLADLDLRCLTWDLSSLIMDCTHTPRMGSMESQPLDFPVLFFLTLFLTFNLQTFKTHKVMCPKQASSEEKSQDFVWTRGRLPWWLR